MPKIPCFPGAARANGRIRRFSGVALALALLLATPAAAGTIFSPDPIFASELVSFTHTTAFRGGNVLGRPDRAGLFLGSTLDPALALGTLVLRFSLGVMDGEGCDLIVFDEDRYLRDEAEQAEVAVSRDGLVWSPLGNIIVGISEGRIDFAGQVVEPVFFVRITQLSTSALDLDAVQANYPVPEPGTAGLLAMGLALLALRGRSSRRRCELPSTAPGDFPWT